MSELMFAAIAMVLGFFIGSWSGGQDERIKWCNKHDDRAAFAECMQKGPND